MTQDTIKSFNYSLFKIPAFGKILPCTPAVPVRILLSIGDVVSSARDFGMAPQCLGRIFTPVAQEFQTVTEIVHADLDVIVALFKDLLG